VELMMKRSILPIVVAFLAGVLLVAPRLPLVERIAPRVEAQRQQLMFGTNPYAGGSVPLAVRLTPDGRIQMSQYVRSNAALPGSIATLTPGTTLVLSAVGNTTAYFTGGTHIHQTAAILTGGPPTACTLQLQGSLDATNFYPIGTALTCTATVFGTAVDVPALWVRYALTVLTGTGTLTIAYGGA
jgi:hypothetical protein